MPMSYALEERIRMFGGRAKSMSMRKLKIEKEEPAGQVQVLPQVYTPYGLGHVTGKVGELCTVKFGFGTASIHEGAVVPVDGVSKWLQKVQQEGINQRARVAQLKSGLETFQSENERLSLDVKNARAEHSAARAETQEYAKLLDQARVVMEKEEKKAKVALETKEKVLTKESRLLTALSWSGISEDFTSQISGKSVWRITLQSCELFKDNASWMEGKYLVATIVDEMGGILGRSAQTKTDKLLEPLYILSGSLAEPRFLFLQIKQIKSKSNMMFKFSEMGYSLLDLADEQFTPGEQRLRMYE
mmetsp:Transcript_5991/g.12006  ORF Transcript_5991/g.12006 Transcript_5991/m.12006 type:complete len:302 (-) Transcript_5991:506-1411(-)